MRGSRPPRVSVLLPCRDAAAHLPEAIASLAAQTLEDFEVIAVDDGSTDATGDILAQWARSDQRVVLLRSGPEGLVAALQRALDASAAGFLARMDADDVSEPDRLAAQMALFESRDELAGCGSHVRYFPRAQVRDGARRYERWLNRITSPEDVAREAFVECPIAHPSLMIRREALVRVGGYRITDWPEDYDLVLRLLGSGAQLANVPTVLLHWREHAQRLSRVDARYSQESFARCRAHYLAVGPLSGRRAVVCGAGPVGKRLSRALRSEGARVAAFVEVDGRKLGQQIHGVPVIGYDDIDQYRNAYFLAAVAGEEPRARIREALTERGLIEVGDFCAAA